MDEPETQERQFEDVMEVVQATMCLKSWNTLLADEESDVVQIS